MIFLLLSQVFQTGDLSLLSPYRNSRTILAVNILVLFANLVISHVS